MTPQQRLDSVLRSWQGTPWGAGQCCRGRAVDCRYFVCAVFDELYGVSLPLPPRMPLDTAANNRAGAFAGLRQLIERYPSETLANDPEPGDVLIVRPPLSHPLTLQHAMIVGVGGQLWHAGRGGVAFIQIGSWQITHGFRMLEKNRW